MYENMTIVQYDRGNMGEFMCLLLYKKIFGEAKYEEKRPNNLGWYFMNVDSTVDCLLYDYHRSTVESVNNQRAVFGTCAYEEILAGNYEEARRIMHAMINYRKQHPNTSPEALNVMELPDPDYSYDPDHKVLTRIHAFDPMDLTKVFPGATIYNLYSPPEKRWIFKFLYLYKKHRDSVENTLQRLTNGLDEFWNFNWVRNCEPKDGLINIDCYEIFLGNTNEHIGPEYADVLAENFENNKSMLERFGLDHTRDNVSSEELLAILTEVYSKYEYYQ